MRTYTPKLGDTERKWYIIDAEGIVLGRLATTAANLLRGKHKATYTPNSDQGDYVVIINADKVVLTGKKLQQKFAYHHSGYPGGLRATRYADLMQKAPEKAVFKAIKGMVPHTKLGAQQLKKLKVYAGSEHPHEGQQPIPYELKKVAQ